MPHCSSIHTQTGGKRDTASIEDVEFKTNALSSPSTVCSKRSVRMQLPNQRALETKRARNQSARQKSGVPGRQFECRRAERGHSCGRARVGRPVRLPNLGHRSLSRGRRPLHLRFRSLAPLGGRGTSRTHDVQCARLVLVDMRSIRASAFLVCCA